MLCTTGYGLTGSVGGTAVTCATQCSYGTSTSALTALTTASLQSASVTLLGTYG